MSFSCDRENEIEFHNIQIIPLILPAFLPPNNFPPTIIHFEAAEKYIQFSVIFLLPFLFVLL